MYDKINEDQSSGNLHSGDDLFNKILGYAM